MKEKKEKKKDNHFGDAEFEQCFFFFFSFLFPFHLIYFCLIFITGSICITFLLILSFPSLSSSLRYLLLLVQVSTKAGT